MSKIIVVDEDRCLGCCSCMLACALAHSDAESLVEALQAETPPQSRVHVEPIGEFGMPLQCRHCEEAPCMIVCPKEALTRLSPDDPVRLDSELCNGCGFCTFVCPYGVIEVSPADRKAVRCDLCRDRTEAGQPPACVAACPTKALRFEELSEDIRRRRREDAERVAANDARYVQERKGEAKKVVCEICGDAFMPWKLLERLRSQVPASVPVPNVCPVCRRKEVARLLSQHLIASTGPGR